MKKGQVASLFDVLLVISLLINAVLVAALLYSWLIQRRQVNAYREEARRDVLTSAWNRRAWEERLAEEISRAERNQLPLSLALIDVVGLKAVNDQSGLQSGDRLLQELVKRIRTSIRDYDFLARYGGDEFAILFPQTSPQDLKGIADRLTHCVHSSASAESAPITIRLVLSGSDNPQQIKLIWERADLAMVRMKGRSERIVEIVDLSGTE